MIDRKISPLVNDISKIDFLSPETWTLRNGAKVWGIKAGTQDLVKIDFMFNAGSWFQASNLVAGLTNAYMNQGSKNYSAQQIAEAFDFRGAYLQLSADQQHGYVSILTLNKYFDEILKVTADVIKHPTFPAKEIKTQIAKKKQWFIVENSKVKMLAQKKFSQVLFGENHPYANTNTASDYDKLTREQLVQFHAENYRLSECKILIAGNYSDEMKEQLEFYFGGEEGLAARETVASFPIVPAKEQAHFVDKDDALQSAIRIGKLVVNRDHPDFHGLNILSTILGGYFGSRLMTNIREDKGYTYGIGSAIFTFPHASYFAIVTEVGTEVCSDALTEIYFEIEKLQNDLVGDDELDVVKNYLLGEMLRSIDGVFAMSGSFHTLLEAGLDFSHYRDFVTAITKITPEEIMQLAQKYLNKEELFQVVAGKRQ